METSYNYQQLQVKGQRKKTVIIDSSITDERDELDSKFKKRKDLVLILVIKTKQTDYKGIDDDL